MGAKVKLNLRGLEEAAKFPGMHAAIDAAAEAMAANVRAQGIKVGALKGDAEIDLPVEVLSGRTTSGMQVNRAQAIVAIQHPSGTAVQAKHGALTKAASAAGLEVKGK